MMREIMVTTPLKLWGKPTLKSKIKLRFLSAIKMKIAKLYMNMIRALKRKVTGEATLICASTASMRLSCLSQNQANSNWTKISYSMITSMVGWMSSQVLQATWILSMWRLRQVLDQEIMQIWTIGQSLQSLSQTILRLTIDRMNAFKIIITMQSTCLCRNPWSEAKTQVAKVKTTIEIVNLTMVFNKQLWNMVMPSNMNQALISSWNTERMKMLRF